MLIAARSSGRPTRLLRTASVTNSSISLPTWRVMPRDDLAGRLRATVMRAVVVVGERVEERLDAARCRGSSPVALVRATCLGQHRVAEAVDRVRELGADRRVDLAVVAAPKNVDLRLHLARELLEHEVLVLHLGDEARGLEQALAVLQLAAGELPGRGLAASPRLEDQVLDLADAAGCARRGTRGGPRSAPMFSLPRPSPVTKCAAEQLVVVGRADVVVRRRPDPRRRSAAGPVSSLTGLRGGRCRRGTRGRCRRPAVASIAGPSAVAVDVGGLAPFPSPSCGKPFGPGMKWPYGSVRSSGTSSTSVSSSSIPRMSRAWALTSSQLREAARRRPPSSSRPVATGRAVAQLVLAQEDLVRGMRGVGLVLVDERRRRVRVLVERRPAGSSPG